ncbi:PEP-utilizing enzyme [Actinoplanes couchii]|uniref:PEP-utilising enzyme mobile domain-containing protein n=1 Tax=Actinoplanes couchii TaxID=403638 RepID=A0ABQ3XSE9_9ACTN|nr:PEP-utilizing enzyme [Actinoplanes couchii]MDR6315915.1 phosphohistidine swiveling domain-containing protein [Actinoplanes couchii]GID61435.1 hypothetical protein Aco03nite_098390 [Actinoplanes couchii]
MLDGWQVQLRGRSRFHLLECWLDSFGSHLVPGLPSSRVQEVLSIGREAEWTVLLRDEDVARIAHDGQRFVADRDAVGRLVAATATAAEACLAAARVCRAAAADVPSPVAVAALTDFFATYTRLQSLYQGTSPLVTADAENELAAVLTAHPQAPPDALVVLTSGDSRRLRSFQESIEWLRLLLPGGREPIGPGERDRILRQHAEAFEYVGALSDRLGVDSLAICQERWQRDSSRSVDELADELRRITSAAQKGLQARDRLLEGLDLTERARGLADNLALLGVTRLAVREEFTRAAHTAYPAFQAVFETVGDRLDVPDGVRQLSRAEVVALAAGAPVDLQRVRMRLRFGVCSIRRGGKELSEGAAARELVTTLAPRRGGIDVSDPPGTLLPGLGVSGSDPVVGKVRVLPPGQSREEQLAEAERLGHDEILVVGMTYPALVPSCARVAGIITDFGGLTCHAAVIARASGVPCIVGTRVATDRLRTGDLVRLDPVRSVVELLSSVRPGGE